MTSDAIFCEHANEVPYTCPCDADCYCKENTCRTRGSKTSAPVRVALCGASGTGKTTLANYLVGFLGLPFNPVGSRSVSKAMGFETPYDVDKAGKRAEFQRRLVIEKRAWEDDHESFVTDRTTLDNLAYTMLHDVYAVDASLLQQIVEGLNRYTHIIYCPVNVFCNPGGDPNRVADMTYHELYDTVLKGLLLRYRPKGSLIPVFHTLHTADPDARRAFVRMCLGVAELP